MPTNNYAPYDDYDERGGKHGTKVLFGILLAVCLFMVSLPALVGSPSYKCRVSHVVAEEGDTLDGISREWCEGDTDEVVNLLVKMYGVLIDVGQVIHLPIPQE